MSSSTVCPVPVRFVPEWIPQGRLTLHGSYRTQPLPDACDQVRQLELDHDLLDRQGAPRGADNFERAEAGAISDAPEGLSVLMVALWGLGPGRNCPSPRQSANACELEGRQDLELSVDLFVGVWANADRSAGAGLLLAHGLPTGIYDGLLA